MSIILAIEPDRRQAAHLARLGHDRNLAIVFQVELRQSTKFMERFLTPPKKKDGSAA